MTAGPAPPSDAPSDAPPASPLAAAPGEAPAPPVGSAVGPGPGGAPGKPALDDVAPVPPLAERVAGVLTAPFDTLRRHDPAWGWLGPWALVSLAGLLFGLVYLARVDVTAHQAAERERALDRLPAAQRRAIDQPEVQETMKTFGNATAFLTKVGLILGPPLLGVCGLVLGGGLVFVAALAHRGHGARVDLTRAISLAAHASLANLVTLGATTVGALAGNPRPQASPAALVDAIERPALAAALGRLDPSTVLYYVVLAAGLSGSIGLPRRRAVAVAVAAWAAASLLTVGAAAASLAVSGGGGS